MFQQVPKLYFKLYIDSMLNQLAKIPLVMFQQVPKLFNALGTISWTIDVNQTLAWINAKTISKISHF